MVAATTSPRRLRWYPEGKVTAINIVSPGAFYTAPPAITISGAGTGATAVANMAVIVPSSADLTPGLSQALFFQALQDERGRELACEALRKPDLIRWGILTHAFTDMINLINTTGAPATTGGSVTLNYLLSPYKNYNPNYQLLPIPTTEISTNSLIKQNPGY